MSGGGFLLFGEGEQASAWIRLVCVAGTQAKTISLRPLFKGFLGVFNVGLPVLSRGRMKKERDSQPIKLGLDDRSTLL